MALRYPVLVIVIVIALVCYFVFSKKKSDSYGKGSKIANTDYLKKTPYFSKKMKEYQLYKNAIFITFAFIILSSTILVSRLARVDTANINQYNRDIFICMDVSTSVDELNVELLENFKDKLNKFDGERIGVSIFNTSSVVLVPLTEDYTYVKDVLDTIQKAIKATNANYGQYQGDDYFYLLDYIRSGTLEDNVIRGSSLIGDGLASCVYSFSDANPNRTKIIIFSTDNDLEGKPLVTMSQAAKIGKEKNVKVFGIGTKKMSDEDRAEFKSTVEYTGGKYYEHSTDTVNNIISDIESTSKSLLNNQSEKKKIDIPAIPFVILVISFSSFLIVSKKVIR